MPIPATTSKFDQHDGDPSNKKKNVINDVIAIKNDHYPFKIGKISQVFESSYQMTLFNYKLDIKTESVMDEDILCNFGNIGNKTIFELDDAQQTELLNTINFFDDNSVMNQLLFDLKKKDERICMMHTTIDQILQKLIASNTCSDVLKDIIIDHTIDLNEILIKIFNNVNQLNDEKVMYLSKVIAEILTRNKLLSSLQQQSFIDSISKKKFMRQILKNIHELSVKLDREDSDGNFFFDYAALLENLILNFWETMH